MNVYRCTGIIGAFAGTMALILTCMPEAQAATWIFGMVADPFRSNVLLHTLGGIAAIASGSYLFTFGKNE
jgi:hypothetical protein